MAWKHYYVPEYGYGWEDKNPAKKGPSIQFNESVHDGRTIVCVESFGEDGRKGLQKLCVSIPLEEIKNAYEWLTSKS